jgi:hypothetical protein
MTRCWVVMVRLLLCSGCGVQIESRGREFTVSALNERGKVLLSAIGDGLEGLEGVGMDRKDDKIHGTVSTHMHTQTVSCGSHHSTRQSHGYTGSSHVAPDMACQQPLAPKAAAALAIGRQGMGLPRWPRCLTLALYVHVCVVGGGVGPLLPGGGAIASAVHLHRHPRHRGHVLQVTHTDTHTHRGQDTMGSWRLVGVQSCLPRSDKQPTAPL